jgi:hypothetical protein
MQLVQRIAPDPIYEGKLVSSIQWAALLAAFASYVVLVVLAVTRKDPNNVPSDVAPDALAPRLASIGPIPWFAHNARTRRHELICREPHCLRGEKAYTVLLPEDSSTLYLSTQAMLRTGHPDKYPVATVLVIGPNSEVRYIVDMQNNERSGIRPTILQDTSLRNMGHTWSTQESHPSDGRNVTGNKAHSFVLVNESPRQVLMCIKSLDGPTAESQDFVRLESGTFTLFWPSGNFYGNANRTWKSMTLSTDSYDHAASIAESLMYEILA